MGNHSRKGKPKVSTQASSIQRSGEAGGNGSDGTLAEQRVLTIKLVKLVPLVLAQCSVNEPVQVVWNGAAFEVLYKQQRLGNVPAYHNNTLTSSRHHRGRIIEAFEQPPSATIEVVL